MSTDSKKTDMFADFKKQEKAEKLKEIEKKKKSHVSGIDSDEDLDFMNNEKLSESSMPDFDLLTDMFDEPPVKKEVKKARADDKKKTERDEAAKKDVKPSKVDKKTKEEVVDSKAKEKAEKPPKKEKSSAPKKTETQTAFLELNIENDANEGRKGRIPAINMKRCNMKDEESRLLAQSVTDRSPP